MSKWKALFFAFLTLLHESSGQVLDGAKTAKHCTGKTCGTLYFLNREGEEMTRAQGSGNLEGRGVKGVAMVQQVGTGCFTIFKGKHQKGAFFELRGNSEIDLKKEGILMTTIRSAFSSYFLFFITRQMRRSIKYSAHCKKKSGVVWWQPVVCILLILIVGGLIIAFVRQRRKARGAPLPTKEVPDVTAA